jgi:hypothetical protein
VSISNRLPFSALADKTPSRTLVMLVDLEDRVISILGGQPKDKKWHEDVILPAMDAFNRARQRLEPSIKPSSKPVHRGHYLARNAGAHHGNSRLVRPNPPVQSRT